MFRFASSIVLYAISPKDVKGRIVEFDHHRSWRDRNVSDKDSSPEIQRRLV